MKKDLYTFSTSHSTLCDHFSDGGAENVDAYFNDTFTLFLGKLQAFKDLKRPITEEEDDVLTALLAGLVHVQALLYTEDKEKRNRLIKRHSAFVAKAKRRSKE